MTGRWKIAFWAGAAFLTWVLLGGRKAKAAGGINDPALADPEIIYEGPASGAPKGI